MGKEAGEVERRSAVRGVRGPCVDVGWSKSRTPKRNGVVGVKGCVTHVLGPRRNGVVGSIGFRMDMYCTRTYSLSFQPAYLIPICPALDAVRYMPRTRYTCRQDGREPTVQPFTNQATRGRLNRFCRNRSMPDIDLSIFLMVSHSGCTADVLLASASSRPLDDLV